MQDPPNREICFHRESRTSPKPAIDTSPAHTTSGSVFCFFFVNSLYASFIKFCICRIFLQSFFFGVKQCTPFQVTSIEYFIAYRSSISKNSELNSEIIRQIRLVEQRWARAFARNPHSPFSHHSSFENLHHSRTFASLCQRSGRRFVLLFVPLDCLPKSLAQRTSRTSGERRVV